VPFGWPLVSDREGQPQPLPVRVVCGVLPKFLQQGIDESLCTKPFIYCEEESTSSSSRFILQLRLAESRARMQVKHHKNSETKQELHS
jgi:hypothetical protein